MTPRKVFLDVGGHVGETVSVVVDPRWGFDRIWTFEPTAACRSHLEAFDDERVTVVPSGLWSSDAEMDIFNPGEIDASVLVLRTTHAVERCTFLDAAGWIHDHLEDDDEVWMKVNVEGAEVEILDRLLDSGEISKIDHLVVYFDIEMSGGYAEAAEMRRRLDAAGVPWGEASDVLAGRTDAAKLSTWLEATMGGSRLKFWWRRTEQRARRRVFRVRRYLRR